MSKKESKLTELSELTTVVQELRYLINNTSLNRFSKETSSKLKQTLNALEQKFALEVCQLDLDFAASGTEMAKARAERGMGNKGPQFPRPNVDVVKDGKVATLAPKAEVVLSDETKELLDKRLAEEKAKVAGKKKSA